MFIGSGLRKGLRIHTSIWEARLQEETLYIYRIFFLLFLIRGKVVELLYVHVHKGERKGR